MYPAHTKSSALNIACVIRWNNVNIGYPMANLAIITPSWRRVERAIIFLKSDSVKADSPAISMVNEAVINRIVLNKLIVDKKG